MSSVERKDIIVHAMPTDDQMADILPKPLPEASFKKTPPVNHGVVERMRWTEGSVLIVANSK